MKESIVTLALASLRESPTNPRKTFGDAGLAELADSIKSQGVLQPIVVRPLGQGDRDIRHTHEIVFGHRRSRAARLAGLEQVPVIVRAMSDEAAAIAQLHENLEREDVHPIEEGDAYRALMHTHGVTTEQLIEQTGKSRTYIYNRLKLAQVSAPVRAACLAGEIGAEAATLLARVPAVLQAKAMEHCYATEWRDGQRVRGEPMSYRQIKIRLEQGYTRELAEASFALEQSYHCACACIQCPQRSDAEPVLLGELGPNVCTDPPCFEAKTAEHKLDRIAQARAQGRYLEGPDATEPAVVSLRHDVWHGHIGTEFKWVDLGQALQRLQAAGHPAAHAVVHLRMVRDALDECLLAEDARRVESAFGQLMAPDTPTTRDGDTAASSAQAGDPSEAAQSRRDPFDGWTDTERLPLDPDAWARVRQAVLAEVLRRPRTLDELRLMAQRELLYGFDDFGLVHQALGLDKAFRSDCNMAAASGQPEPVDVEWLSAWISSAPADTLGAMLAALAIDEALDLAPYTLAHTSNSRDRVLSALALVRAYGIDPDAAAAPPADPGAAPAAEGVQASALAEVAPEVLAKHLAAGVRYLHPATGQTWTGRGQVPAWLRHITTQQGVPISHFELPKAPERCPNTADMIGTEA